MSSGSNVINDVVTVTPFVSLKNKKFVFLLVVLSVALAGAGYYYFIRPKITETYSSSTIRFVLFYAPWCGHSKSFLPIFDKFMESCKTNDKLKHISVEKIDCDTDKEACAPYRVQGYPTMLLIKGDKASDIVEYNSGRTEDAMTKWCEDTIE